MPLVKRRKNRRATRFVHVADGAELPGDGAVLVSAARFLEDPEALLQRAGKVGVIWPNNRDVDDLVPYLDRLAAGRAGVSRRSATAAPIARRACCASATAMTASCAPPARCCATSSCSCCAPASTPSRSKKDSDAEAFAETAAPLLGVLPADRRRPRHRAAPADAAASFGERRPVNARVHQALTAKHDGPVAGAGARPRAARRIAGRSHRGGAEDRRPRAAGAGVVVRHGIGGAAQGDGGCRSGDSRGLPRHRLAVRGDAGLSRYADRSAWPARCPLDQAARRNAVARGSRRANCGSPIPMPAAASARSSRWRGR